MDIIVFFNFCSSILWNIEKNNETLIIYRNAINENQLEMSIYHETQIRLIENKLEIT